MPFNVNRIHAHARARTHSPHIQTPSPVQIVTRYCGSLEKFPSCGSRYRLPQLSESYRRLKNLGTELKYFYRSLVLPWDAQQTNFVVLALEAVNHFFLVLRICRLVLVVIPTPWPCPSDQSRHRGVSAEIDPFLIVTLSPDTSDKSRPRDELRCCQIPAGAQAGVDLLSLTGTPPNRTHFNADNTVSLARAEIGNPVVNVGNSLTDPGAKSATSHLAA